MTIYFEDVDISMKCICPKAQLSRYSINDANAQNNELEQKQALKSLPRNYMEKEAK